MTESFPSRSFSVLNLLVSHWVMTIFLIFNLGLGGFQSLRANSRVRFSETADLVFLAILLSMSLIGIISNSVFVIGQCFALRKRGIAVSWSHQALILMALIPWFGWKFFDNLASANVPVSHPKTGCAE